MFNKDEDLVFAFDFNLPFKNKYYESRKYHSKLKNSIKILDWNCDNSPVDKVKQNNSLNFFSKESFMKRKAI